MRGHEETIIDLRSDTVTKPTEEMRAAMAQAVVGDDVLGDDPTVRRLEEMAAALLGKEAALFLPSGTMANLVALMAHTVPGQEVLLGEASHIYCYEVGGLSRVAGLLPRLFRGDDGHPSPDELRSLLRPANVHFPTTALLCLENTHNLAGGVVLSPERMRVLIEVAREAGLAVHLDGARVLHAATALGVDVRELTADVDSVMLALSKGLSAPIGSVLAGSRDFIVRAHKARKLLGGGMRQVGVVAAAGIVALEKMVSRLGEDHAVAGDIADELAAIDGIDIDRSRVQTNIILFSVPDEQSRFSVPDEPSRKRSPARAAIASQADGTPSADPTSPADTLFPADPTSPVDTLFPADPTSPVDTPFPVDPTFPADMPFPVDPTFPVDTPSPAAATTPTDATPADAFLARLAAHGVLAVAMGRRQVRFVTHRHVRLEDVPRIAAAVRASL